MSVLALSVRAGRRRRRRIEEESPEEGERVPDLESLNGEAEWWYLISCLILSQDLLYLVLSPLCIHRSLPFSF